MSRLTNARRQVEAAKTTRRLPTVFASAYEPAGDRSRILVVTSACSYCGGRHHHFLKTLAGLMRKQAGCRRGRYLISIARTYRRHGGLEVVDRAAA